tara:strand:- start:44 stop:157 length:114 start_codon:yes stop_codon:yes gene_type:complete
LVVEAVVVPVVLLVIVLMVVLVFNFLQLLEMILNRQQ